jgi:hypothetical protein
MNGQNKLELHYYKLERLALDKHSSLFGLSSIQKKMNVVHLAACIHRKVKILKAKVETLFVE